MQTDPAPKLRASRALKAHGTYCQWCTVTAETRALVLHGLHFKYVCDACVARFRAVVLRDNPDFTNWETIMKRDV